MYRVNLPLRDSKYDRVAAYLNLPFTSAEMKEMTSLDVQPEGGRRDQVGKNSKKPACRARSPDDRATPVEHPRRPVARRNLALAKARDASRTEDEAEKETSRPSSESARSGEEIQGSIQLPAASPATVPAQLLRWSLREGARMS